MRQLVSPNADGAPIWKAGTDFRIIHDHGCHFISLVVVYFLRSSPYICSAFPPARPCLGHPPSPALKSLRTKVVRYALWSVVTAAFCLEELTLTTPRGLMSQLRL